MKVKFIREVVSSIGTFVVDEIHELEDKHVVSNWVENGLIELIEDIGDKPKKKETDKKGTDKKVTEKKGDK